MRVNFSLSKHLFVFNAVLIDGVVVSAGQESTLGLNDAEAPSLSIVVGGIDKLFVGPVNIHGLNDTIVVTNKNFSVHDVEGGSKMEDLKLNLSEE